MTEGQAREAVREDQETGKGAGLPDMTSSTPTVPSGSGPSVSAEDDALASIPASGEMYTTSEIREAILAGRVRIVYEKREPNGSGVVTLKIGAGARMHPAVKDVLATMLLRFPVISRRRLGIKWVWAATQAIKVLQAGGFVHETARGHQARYTEKATPGAIRAYLRELSAK